MTFAIRFVNRVLSPDKPRNRVTRYGLSVVLPLASIVITQSLFPSDRLPFSPILLLSIVFSALLGGISGGLAATVVAALADALTLRRPPLSLHISSFKDLVH